MGINRYDKAPEWTPPVLPYELILKAADMTQQRWDKGVAEGDRMANDLFSKVKVVPTSVDEQVNLPAIRQEYQNLRSQLINDPDMNATKFQYAIQDFTNKHRATLDRMTGLAAYAEADAVTRNKNIADAEWSAGNTYIPSNIPDWRMVDSTQRDQPWETMLTSRGTSNWDKFTTENYLKDWKDKTQLLEKDPVTGGVTKVDGKVIDDLHNIAKSSGAQYMNTTNFKDWASSGQLNGWNPDDAMGTNYFGGKNFEDLSPYQQAQAMVMASGYEQLNIDKTMTQGFKQTTNSTADAKMAAIAGSDPYAVFLGTNTISTNEMALISGKNVSKQGGYDVVAEDIPPNYMSRLGLNTDDPEIENTIGLLTASEEVFSGLGIRSALNEYQQALDESRKLNIDFVNDKLAQTAPSVSAYVANSQVPNFNINDPSSGYGEKIANNKKRQESALKALQTSLEKTKNSSHYLNLVEMLSSNGYDASSPSKVAEAMTAMSKKIAEAKANMTINEQEVRDAISLSFFGEGGKALVNYDGDNNIIDLGTSKVAKGVVMAGNSSALMNRLDNIDDSLIDSSWFSDTGQFESIEEFNKEYPGMFVQVGTDDKGETLWGIRVYTPLNLYDTKKHMNYDDAKMGTGSNWDVTRGAFLQNSSSLYIQDKITRSYNMMEKNPKYISSLKTAALSMVQNMPNTPDAAYVKQEVKRVIDSAENNKMEFAHVYQALVMFGGDPILLSKYFRSIDGGNPQQPQGTTSNPLGGLK